MVALGVGVWALAPDRVTAREPRSEGAAPIERGEQEGLGQAAVDAQHRAEVRIRVRDMLDGSGAPNLELGVIMTGERTIAQSDADGFIVVPDGAAVIADAPTGWTLASGRPVDGEVWVYRHVVVTGSVRFLGERAPSPTEVRLECLAPRFDKTLQASREIASHSWLRKRSIRIPSDLGAPDQNGRFKVRLPRLRSIVIRARCPDWRPDWKFLEMRRDSETLHVEMRLERGATVKGVLRDPAGKPIVGAKVRAYIVQPGQFEDLDPKRVGMNHRDGVTAVRSKKRNYSRRTVKAVSRTDDAGRFEINALDDGNLWLVAYIPGRAPIHVAYGPAKLAPSRLELTVRSREQDHVVLTRANKPIDDTVVLVTNVSLAEIQPAFTLRTDSNGRIPTTWFIAGNEYGFVVGGNVGYLRWNRPRTVELNDLPVRPQSIR